MIVDNCGQVKRTRIGVPAGHYDANQRCSELTIVLFGYM